MVPLGRPVKVSLYIIDLQVMTMFPLSPLRSVYFCTQLVLVHGGRGELGGCSHLPAMLHNFTSRDGVVYCLFLVPPTEDCKPAGFDFSYD